MQSKTLSSSSPATMPQQHVLQGRVRCSSSFGKHAAAMRLRGVCSLFPSLFSNDATATRLSDLCPPTFHCHDRPRRSGNRRETQSAVGVNVATSWSPNEPSLARTAPRVIALWCPEHVSDRCVWAPLLRCLKRFFDRCVWRPILPMHRAGVSQSWQLVVGVSANRRANAIVTSVDCQV